jgi:glycosyltransferase involved in cell wall biosynthesis
MKQPLLHVMIPAYGESPYIRQTLESAVKYLPLGVPITVIEDPTGYGDLEKIVKEFPRVGYEINKYRLGIAENFNKCLNKSTGVFTQICGSDDVFIGDPTISLSRFNLTDTKISVVGMNVKTINEDGIEKVKLPDIVKKLISPNVNESIIFKNSKIFANLMIGDWLYFPAIMWRTNTVLNYKFSGEFHTAMDLDILLRIISDELQIGFVNEYVIGYRRHDKSASSLYAKSIYRVEEEYLCHRNAISIAKRNKWILGLIFAQIAPTVRAHALLEASKNFFTDTETAIKLLKKVFTPISK